VTPAEEMERPHARGYSRVLLALCVGAILVASKAANAQPPNSDDSAAKALFDHGLEEMKQGHYAEGCGALAESYKLDPLPGALFTLAECEAKRGRIATAVKRYEEYVALFVKLPRDKQMKQHGRDVLCKEQIGILSAKVPHVTLLLGAQTPAGLAVTIDGVPVESSALAGPIPVDPGEHVVFAKAPGAGSAEQRFTIDTGEQKTVSLSLVPEAKPPVAPPSDAPSPSPMRVAGFVTGGLGLAFIGVGAVTGGLALGKKSTIQNNCMLDGTRGIATCNPVGLDAGHAVTTLGAVSTGTFVVGGVALGVGVGLLVASRASPKNVEKNGGRAFRVGVLSAGPAGALLGTEGAW
jgi:hypothetical protein